ncbi:hypothetical protein HZR84_04710 [Hyphobacterium sp. CCMP332]|nr:hypothetical protein HZR84_04710 [Hyphobacterium sp. CCMP332]
MKIYIFTVSILTLFSCSQNDKKTRDYYVESQPTFFDLKHGDWTTNDWIRKPENLKIIHETFKKFGYMDLIGSRLNDNPLILQGIYIKNKPYNLIDSLIIAFDNKDLDVKYYREFWLRRQKEKNDTVVYEILKDIKSTYMTFLTPEAISDRADMEFVNDTLLQLLEIEYPDQPLTKDLAIEHFKTLNELGFHQSAYNLLFERSEYSGIDWNKEQLKEKLRTTEDYVYPWFEDNEK